MEGLRIETKRLTITSGANQVTADIEPTLSESGNLYVGAVAKGDNSKLISIGIYDSGNTIVEPIDVSHFQKDGKDIVESSIPIQHRGGRKLDIVVSTNGRAVSADTDIEVIFIGNAGNRQNY